MRPPGWLSVLIALAMALLLPYWWLQRDASTPASKTATATGLAEPQVQLGEPDLFLERPMIAEYGDRGVLRYALLAQQIRYFDADAITRLTAPRLTLHTSVPPWQARSGQGFIRTMISPQGVPEELVFLSDDVSLRQSDELGRFLIISSAQVYVYPDRKFARSDRSVTIDTDVGRTEAAGFTADLAAGTVLLSAGPSQRVHTIVSKDQFK